MGVTRSHLPYVGRMGLAPPRECEGPFRRHADGTNTGEFSEIHPTRHVFALLSREFTEEQGHAGNTERGVVIRRRIRM